MPLSPDGRFLIQEAKFLISINAERESMLIQRKKTFIFQQIDSWY